MLKTLLKKQMAEMFRNYFYDSKKNRSRSTGSVVVFILLFVFLMVVVMGGMFTVLSLMLCRTLAEMDLGWLYFVIMGLMAIFLGAFGSVFNTYSALYLSRDNDLLLSLPIPVRTIITARLLGVYLMGLMYSAVVFIPALGVYFVIGRISIAAVVGGLLLFALITLIVLVLSCLLGWVVARVSLKLKNKSLITVLLSLVLIGAYYFFYFKAQDLVSDLLSHADAYSEKIKGAAYPLYLFGRVGTGDWLAMLMVSVAVALIVGLTWLLLSRSFLQIATATGKGKAARYRETRAHSRTPSRALLGKEFGRFFSSPNYILNCGFGILLLPALGVFLLIRGRVLMDILEEALGQQTDIVPVLLCAAVCMVASMNNMAAPSVSLEGKNLWLPQSLPVTPWQVLRAKLSLQLVLTGIPVLLCLALAVPMLYRTPLVMALVVIVALSYTFLSACLGLALGVKMPNLTWTNEVVPIKQGAPVMISLLGGWLYAIAFGAGYFLIGRWTGAVLYMTVFAVVTLAAAYLLYGWLKRGGSRLFADL